MLRSCGLSADLRPRLPALLRAAASRRRAAPRGMMSSAPQASGATLSSGDGASHAEVFKRCAAILPALDPSKYKGQAGKVGVVGGCREYTGAPFFAAHSALLVGADLSHVFCTHDAALVIKTYSPELIVHPALRQADEPLSETREPVSDVAAWFTRLDALAVGSGLGRDPEMLRDAAEIVERALKEKIPVVLDGDGLALAAEGPGGVLGRAGGKEGLSRVVLTPNPNELKRLCHAWGLAEAEAAAAGGVGPAAREAVKQLAAKIGGATVLRKGITDIVSDGTSVLECAGGGSPRRCGGQGDVLAGTTAVFLAWAEKAGAGATEPWGAGPVAAVAAAHLVRAASEAAFARRRRSMVAGDVIAELGAAMEATYPTAGATPQQ